MGLDLGLDTFFIFEEQRLREPRRARGDGGLDAIDGGEDGVCRLNRTGACKPEKGDSFGGVCQRRGGDLLMGGDVEGIDGALGRLRSGWNAGGVLHSGISSSSSSSSMSISMPLIYMTLRFRDVFAFGIGRGGGGGTNFVRAGRLRGWW